MDFLESSICPLNTPFGFFFIEVSMFMYTLQKDDFLLTFRRTYNVLIHNSQMKHFLPKLVSHKVVKNWILFKMRGGGKISDKVCESYAWSKFCWLLSEKAQFRNFDFWSNLEFSWWIMINPWSNDECDFNIWCWPKMMKFDSMLTTIDLANLSCEAWNLTRWYLETYEDAWWLLEAIETIFYLRSSKP